MNRRKKGSDPFFAFFAGLVVLLCWPARAEPTAQVRETPGFTVKIEARCAEGEVTCGDVRYEALDKASGRTLRLRGRTHHSLCADGVTPCRFLGYVFRRGAVTHFVGEDGRLEMRKGERILREEKGAWQ